MAFRFIPTALLLIALAFPAIHVAAEILEVLPEVHPEPEKELVCAYSELLGFNPWERWQFVAFEGETKVGGALHGRILADDVTLGSSPRVNIYPTKGTEAHKFAISATGKFKISSGSMEVKNGGIEAYEDFILTTSFEVNGDFNTITGKCEPSSGLKVRGNLNAGGNIALDSSSEVAGNIHTNGDLTLKGSNIWGNVIVGKNLVMQQSAQIMGQALVQNADGYEPTSGNKVMGAINEVPTPPPMPVTFSTDVAAVKAYFIERSQAWKEEPNSVVNARVNEAGESYKVRRALYVRLHSKVNFYTITREVLVYVTKIVLSGHPGGFLIINVPGAADINLQDKLVFTSDRDGVEVQPSFGRLLLNFYECTGEIKIDNIHNLPGSGDGGPQPAAVTILAPGATVKAESQVLFKGNIIAKTILADTSSGKFYNVPFGTPGTRPLYTVPAPPKPPAAPSSARFGEALCMWHHL